MFSYTSTTPVSVADGGGSFSRPPRLERPRSCVFPAEHRDERGHGLERQPDCPSASFALEQLPAMPFSLDPTATATFVIRFTPSTTGSLTATLQVNSSSFTVSGSGAQPAALPSYQFQTPTTSPQPAQQPAVGLALSAPYPVDINGALKLTFVSSVFTDDPAIQFATGGRTVNFTVPANSTQALFNLNPSIALQTGTTAGSIVITPSFAMRSGFDMTPSTPDALTITVPRTAPQIISATVTSASTTSFTVALSGYSTTRTIRQLDVQFTPKAGESFSTTRMSIDVTSASSAWYQGAASQTTGGSFLAAIPFVLQNGSSTEDLVHRLQSLSITATNDAGVSTPVTVPIP